MKNGCVYLVGAGCGEADLITLRGMRLLQNCDAVVYDDLIDPALLDLAPTAAERIYMGKRCGKHSAAQADISSKLVALAQAGSRVVRLKGGDPFVFGRGGEEILALQKAGVPYAEVPGISAAIAIPAAAGIPVTHRNVSRSLHIITGHIADDPDALPAQVAWLARSKGTLVFLMGLRHLRQICSQLMEAGCPPDTPAAVISGGNASHPATIRSVLSNLAECAAGLCPPAVIVVGQVAALDLSSRICRPLEGVRIGVTGTQAVVGKLSRSLADLGARVAWVERALPQELPVELDLLSLCTELSHWVVFTSVNGVDLFFRSLARQQVDLRRLRCRFAVIGEATGEALTRRGIYPEICPAVHTSHALADALLAAADPDEEIFLFRSAHGSPELPRKLTAAGLHVRELSAYCLRSDPGAAETWAETVSHLDYLVFSSAGSVERFLQQYGSLPGRAVCVCIGPVTAQALRQAGCSPLVAAEISTAGIIKTILEAHAQTAEAGV
ncbi:uroporphyrinogen III methyltransferase / synthase [Oscillibacter sp. PC13]|uniref:uroporphyrinogen-III C-methyltransferase n=1 Tax=Oscillibacter sp. PC13 TaxID=1855299 RepID=UPI0008E239E8|nr:uroporphyrinogen-III C-methyltransferase [Oscillibacter sp. PC13]SFP72990.1 uroporphyrinogen III methyltransferase / synthase [Oscillibacter sp. PC13]